MFSRYTNRPIVQVDEIPNIQWETNELIDIAFKHGYKFECNNKVEVKQRYTHDQIFDLLNRAFEFEELQTRSEELRSQRSKPSDLDEILRHGYRHTVRYTGRGILVLDLDGVKQIFFAFMPPMTLGDDKISIINQLRKRPDFEVVSFPHDNKPDALVEFIRQAKEIEESAGGYYFDNVYSDSDLDIL